jgi:hypothetical protein
MRKLVAGLFLTLDGVMEAPEQWQFPTGATRWGRRSGRS